MAKVVYDVDSTIIYSIFEPLERAIVSCPKLNPFIVPSHVKYIVTGRNEGRRELTLLLLEQFGIKPKVMLMNPMNDGLYNPVDLMKFKASSLEALKATHYVDDDPFVHLYLPRYWKTGKVIYSNELFKVVY